MFWHIVWYSTLMICGGAFLDIARIVVKSRAQRRGFQLAQEAEMRRLERERDLAPFMEEALREVDAMYPLAPPIARQEQPMPVLLEIGLTTPVTEYPANGAPYPEQPKILPPAIHPAPQLPANVAERPGFAEAAVVSKFLMLDNVDLVSTYWSLRANAGASKEDLDAVRLEMARRYGAAAVDSVDRHRLLAD